MRKIICILLCLFCLSACTKSKKEVMPVFDGISFDADITYYNENYKGSCTLSEKVLTLKVLEPEFLSGYTLTFSEEGVRAEFLGISYTPSSNNMQFSGVGGDFYSVLRRIIDGGEAAKRSGDTYVLKGGKDTDAYTLLVSETGLVQSLQIPDERFSVYFYNTKILGK